MVWGESPNNKFEVLHTQDFQDHIATSLIQIKSAKSPRTRNLKPPYVPYKNREPKIKPMDCNPNPKSLNP